MELNTSLWLFLNKIIMIKKITIFLLFATFLTNGYSQEKITKEKITNTEIVAIDADELWINLVGFGNLELYVPSVIDTTIVQGKGIGAIRTIKLKDNGIIKEQLTYVNSKKMKLKYIMIESPMQISDYKAKIIIKRIDDKNSLVIFQSSYKVSNENRIVMYKTINGFQRTLLSNLKNK